MIIFANRLPSILGLSAEKLATLIVSIALAEYFFKFHSFTLECISFLLVWRGLNWVTSYVMVRQGSRKVKR